MRVSDLFSERQLQIAVCQAGVFNLHAGHVSNNRPVPVWMTDEKALLSLLKALKMKL